MARKASINCEFALRPDQAVMLLNPEILLGIREICAVSDVIPLGHVQSLWGGYGSILRVELKHERPSGSDADTSRAIVKWVNPPPYPSLPRHGESRFAHSRKLRSYQVEHAYYANFAQNLPQDCRVARVLGLAGHKGGWLFVLEDLDAAGFPRRTRAPKRQEIEACLAWLATFHAHFLGRSPDGLWDEAATGTSTPGPTSGRRCPNSPSKPEPKTSIAS